MKKIQQSTVFLATSPRHRSDRHQYKTGLCRIQTPALTGPRLVPVQASRGRSGAGLNRSVPVWAGWCRCRCRGEIARNAVYALTSIFPVKVRFLSNTDNCYYGNDIWNYWILAWANIRTFLLIPALRSLRWKKTTWFFFFILSTLLGNSVR